MSKRKSAQATLLIAFVLALVAGMVVGVAWARHTPAAPMLPTTLTRSWLGDELNLTQQQNEQMRTIWQQVMEGPAVKAAGDHRRALAAEREEAVRKLLTPEQTAQYAKLIQDFDARMAEASKERDKTIQGAVEQTKQILTEPQRQHYEELLLKERSGHSHRGWGPHPPETKPSAYPVTQPAQPGLHDLRTGEGP